MRRWTLGAITLFALAGCGATTAGEQDASDAESPDASVDARSPLDTGGSPDVNPATGDAGPLDASTDASPTDASDGGAPDASTADAGMDAEPDAPTGLPDGPSSTRHRAVPLGSSAAGQGFYEYLPPGYGDGQPRPLLIFVHGLGENGDGDSQLDRVIKNGPPKFIGRDEWPSSRPFIVLSPQHSGGGCTSPGEIDGMIQHALGTYDVDPARVYLTGLSCGGIGIWNYLSSYDDAVAAAVPISGDGKGAWNRAGCALGANPIWAFHGDADGTVNVSGTNVPVDNLLSDCPSPPRAEVIKTIYPGVGHNAWTRTYSGSAGHDIYAWMLTKTRAVAAPSAAPPLASGRSVRLDLGAPALTTSGAWNNLSNASGGTLRELDDDLGDATRTRARVHDAFTNVNPDGSTQPVPGYPVEATQDTFWTGSFNGHADALAESGGITFEALDPGATYTLTLFASRTGDDGGNGRLTRYAVGGVTQDLEVSNNSTDTVTFSGVRPDAAGAIAIDVTVSPAGTSRFAYLGVAVLTRD